MWEGKGTAFNNLPIWHTISLVESNRSSGPGRQGEPGRLIGQWTVKPTHKGLPRTQTKVR